MRFTILSQYYPPEVGAAQVRLAAFARALKVRGHDVQVITAMPNYPAGIIHSAYRGKWWVKEQIDGIWITRTWIYPATGRQVLKRLISYFSFTFTSLLALSSLPKADILFVESPPLFLCMSAWLMAVLRGQKLCINISDLWPDSVVALGIMSEGSFVQAARALERWLYRRAWRVCGVTHGVVKGIIAKGAAPERVLFLPNGVDTQQFQALPYHRIPGEPLQFIYAGTHGYAHGVEVILHAANALRHRSDIRFVLVGAGADKPRLRALAQTLQLPNLIFCDPIPIHDMPALLSQAYAALITVTAGEFFAGTRSAKIFPAMAAGRPILHSGAGEGAELIRQAKAGIVTPPQDVNALVTAILQLADNVDEAVAMGKNGRTFVEQEYSWSAIIEHWLAEVT